MEPNQGIELISFGSLNYAACIKRYTPLEALNFCLSFISAESKTDHQQ